MKLCRKCSETKALDAFAKSSSAKDGKQSNCRPCQTALASAWNKANKGRVREIDRARYERSKDKRKAAMQEIRDRDREAHRAKMRVWSAAKYRRDPEKAKAATGAWAAKNADRVRELGVVNESNRRARTRDNGGAHTRAQRADLVASYLGLCAYCSNKSSALDHIVPLASGGGSEIQNMVPACKSCNSAKKDRSLLTFLVHRKAA